MCGFELFVGGLYGINKNFICFFVFLRCDAFTDNEWNEIKDKVKSGEMTQGQYDDWRYNYPEDLPENIINTLDHCWEKAKQENKKREKNYNPFNEPQKDLLAEFEKIKKEHAEKENEE